VREVQGVKMRKVMLIAVRSSLGHPHHKPVEETHSARLPFPVKFHFINLKAGCGIAILLTK
jgi:hypothetical protein